MGNCTQEITLLFGFQGLFLRCYFKSLDQSALKLLSLEAERFCTRFNTIIGTTLVRSLASRRNLASWNTSPNNVQRKKRIDLNGRSLYVNHFPYPRLSNLLILNGCVIYFWWRDTTNQPLCFIHWGTELLRAYIQTYFIVPKLLFGIRIGGLFTILLTSK